MNINYVYLLDTNILSELVKNPTGIIYEKIKNFGEDKICTSIIVACELKFGAEKKKSAKLKERIELILTRVCSINQKTIKIKTWGIVKLIKKCSFSAIFTQKLGIKHEVANITLKDNNLKTLACCLPPLQGGKKGGLHECLPS